MRLAGLKLRRRRLGAGGAVAAVSGLSIAMAACPALVAASTPQHSSGASHSCAVPAHLRKGQIVVPLVVDFGGPNATVLVTCVVTAPGINGEQLLDDQATRLGYPRPSYCTSGLLWTIDGYPSTACPANPGSDNAYWAYWHGGTSWTYASVGPGEWKVTRGDVEGWRFEVDGKANVPRAPSSAATLEVAAAPPTTTTTASTTPPTTTTTLVTTTTTIASGTGQTPTTTRPRATSTTTRPSGTQASTTTQTSQTSLTITGNAAGPRRPPTGSSGGGSGRLSFIVGAVLVLVLGAAAVVRTRRARLRSL